MGAFLIPRSSLGYEAKCVPIRPCRWLHQHDRLSDGNHGAWRPHHAGVVSTVGNIVIDAFDPYAQTQWWRAVLDDFSDPDGWANEPDQQYCGLATPDGRHLLFQKVSERKRVKNRVHLCLRPKDRSRDEEVDRLLAWGARLVEDHRSADSGWAVLVDPEGNEFCVTMRRPEAAPLRPTEQ
jgi:hypothetical protein